MSNGQQKDSTKFSNGDAVGLLYTLASSHSVCITTFIRSGHGSEAFGMKAIFAFMLMAALSEGIWLSGMGLYLTAWFGCLIYRRIETLNNWRKGMVVHSLFIGWPWLAMTIIEDPPSSAVV